MGRLSLEKKRKNFKVVKSQFFNVIIQLLLTPLSPLLPFFFKKLKVGQERTREQIALVCITRLRVDISKISLVFQNHRRNRLFWSFTLSNLFKIIFFIFWLEYFKEVRQRDEIHLFEFKKENFNFSFPRPILIRI